MEGCAVPPSHSVQLLWPALSLYLPISQSLHDADPEREYVPLLQREHDAAPDALVVPALHA